MDRPLANYYEAVMVELKNDPEAGKLAVNYLSSDLKGMLSAAGIADPAQAKITPAHFSQLVLLIASGKINSRTAKDVLKKMFETGADPNEVIKSEGLEQVSDEGALTKLAEEIITAHPGPVADYKKGKEAALMFFVGKAMQKLGGKANPAVLQKVFKEILSK
jgi:aspartyl-tRNA(Asn)/glutamyl-tRNA(Gln) amidotransferase subunit B